MHNKYDHTHLEGLLVGLKIYKKRKTKKMSLNFKVQIVANNTNNNKKSLF